MLGERLLEQRQSYSRVSYRVLANCFHEMGTRLTASQSFSITLVPFAEFCMHRRGQALCWEVHHPPNRC